MSSVLKITKGQSKQLHRIRSIITFKIMGDLLKLSNELNIDIGKLLKEKKFELEKIQVDYNVFKRNELSFNQQVDEIKTEYEDDFYFNLYKFWYIYLKDGNLVEMYKILGDTDSYKIFGRFREFYNLKREITEVVGGRKRITGGMNLFKLIATTLTIITISPFIIAPGNSTMQIEQPRTSGRDAVVAAINIAEGVHYLTPQDSNSPLIRDIIQNFDVPDSSFDLFLNVVNTGVGLIRPFVEKVNNNYKHGANFVGFFVPQASLFARNFNLDAVLGLIKTTEGDIQLGKNIMAFGHIIEKVKDSIINVVALLHFIFYDPTTYNSYKDLEGRLSDFGNFPDDVKKELYNLKQLSPKEENALPLKHFFEYFSEKGLIDGGKKKKNKKRTKRMKIIRRKTKTKTKTKYRK